MSNNRRLTAVSARPPLRPLRPPPPSVLHRPPPAVRPTRLLRPLFRHDRARLRHLYLAAHSALTAWLRLRTGQPNGQP
ncbi:MAG: hypothetical protein RL077_5111, partial [Verrucomicrobiota bacterium]